MLAHVSLLDASSSRTMNDRASTGEMEVQVTAGKVGEGDRTREWGESERRERREIHDAPHEETPSAVGVPVNTTLRMPGETI